MASRQFVIFTVNEEEFGIEISQVNSIEKPLDIFKVPNTPEFVEGLVNLRGRVYTVFNLRKRFSLAAKDFDESTKIIIVSVNSTMVGFIVDEVKEILKVEDEQIENSLMGMPGGNRRYIQGVAKIGEKIVMLLDLAKVLSVEEAETVERLNV